MSPISDDELAEQVRALRRENDERERREAAGLPREASDDSNRRLDSAIDYILDNMEKFPRSQLDAALMKSGHSAEAIEDIWQGIEEGQAASAFENGPPVIVRAYPGRTQVEAGELFQREAGHAARFGYSPISQSWGEGRPGLGRVAMLGFYSMVFKPKGYLTVTYSRTTQSARAEVGAIATKVCPMCAEEVKAAARICRFCRYEFQSD